MVAVEMQNQQNNQVVLRIRSKKRPAPSPQKEQSGNCLSPSMPILIRVFHNQSVVCNFRAAAGHKKLFRCAAPDALGNILLHSNPLTTNKEDWDEPDRILLHDATLVVDLRMESEVDAKKCQALRQLAPGGPFEEVSNLEDLQTSSSRRLQFRPSGDCGLTTADLQKHAGEVWIGYPAWGSIDQNEKKGRALQELNRRGLPGLFEFILETKRYIRVVLQAITIHLEGRPNGTVVFHCSIGKDRTGMIAMLCSKMIGMSDTEIIDDFCQSSVIQDLADVKYQQLFGSIVDSKTFALSNKEAMQETLAYIRVKYGSTSEYLESIGFGPEWQSRFRNAVM